MVPRQVRNNYQLYSGYPMQPLGRSDDAQRRPNDV